MKRIRRRHLPGRSNGLSQRGGGPRPSAPFRRTPPPLGTAMPFGVRANSAAIPSCCWSATTSTSARKCARTLVEIAGPRLAPFPRCRPRTRACCPTTARSAEAGRGRPDCTRSKQWWRSRRRPRPSRTDRSRPAGRLLPLLLRHARADAGGLGPARRVVAGAGKAGGISLSRPLARLPSANGTWPRLEGRRYDLGVKYGLLTAQLPSRWTATTAKKCWPAWSSCWQRAA